MKIRGLISIILLTLVLGAILAIGSFLSDFKLPGPESLIQIVASNKTSEGKNVSEAKNNDADKSRDYIVFTTEKGSEYKIYIEVADTPEKRAYGLMNRKELARDKGMLFIFDETAMHNFWMKDTLIPLDLIHIQNNEIVEIIEDMQPCITSSRSQTLCPNYPATAVSKYSLEVNAGTIEELSLKVGDSVKIHLAK